MQHGFGELMTAKNVTGTRMPALNPTLGALQMVGRRREGLRNMSAIPQKKVLCQQYGGRALAFIDCLSEWFLSEWLVANPNLEAVRPGGRGCSVYFSWDLRYTATERSPPSVQCQKHQACRKLARY